MERIGMDNGIRNGSVPHARYRERRKMRTYFMVRLKDPSLTIRKVPKQSNDIWAAGKKRFAEVPSENTRYEVADRVYHVRKDPVNGHLLWWRQPPDEASLRRFYRNAKDVAEFARTTAGTKTLRELRREREAKHGRLRTFLFFTVMCLGILVATAFMAHMSNAAGYIPDGSLVVPSQITGANTSK